MMINLSGDTILRLVFATLIPGVLSGLFTLLEKKTKFSAWRYSLKQIVIGITFGIAAILCTQFGIRAGDGVIMNVRDAAPLCAGLFFGGPAGIIAGFMGGVHRYLCVFWGGGKLTQVACSISTCLAGIFSAMMRRRLFENRNSGFLSSFGIGTTMEVLHMLLILATNLRRVSYAFRYVQACSFPMILCTGMAVSLASLLSGGAFNKRKVDLQKKHISYDFGFWLLICVVIAFLATSTFTQQIVYHIITDDAELYRNVTLYLIVFMEILIYTALFILIYEMLKKKVVRNLQKVNAGLNAITNGNLNTVIDVRAYQEFSELSDDVNATVATLKHYIKEAEERINHELEFAHQIQRSALPSSFPPYPNRTEFDIYASMDAAREVGGDFYDFYFVSRNHLAFLVADVSGKGIPAALFMMTAKTIMKDLAESGLPVDEVMRKTNDRLCQNNEAGMFVTAWMGILNVKTGKVTFANAGHNPPLVRHGDGNFEYLKTRSGLVLAGMEGMTYRAGELQLEPEDTIFLYTDGVTEATNLSNELYGEVRLNHVLNMCQSKQVENLCHRVKMDVDTFVGNAPQFDDITMLALTYKGDLHEMTVDATVENITPITEFVDAQLDSHGCSAKAKMQINVAVDEIVSNIAHYAYPDGQGQVTVRMEVEDGAAYITFMDEGIPFDPLEEADPDISLGAEERGVGGLGIFLVKKTMDTLTYERCGVQNVLKMTKRI
ncbi:MAG: SpoIIE family protein phosphatase [Clostridia bacterium]|nr:SpoIIE family protein phosphatase [Clostridia bacterium]